MSPQGLLLTVLWVNVPIRRATVGLGVLITVAGGHGVYVRDRGKYVRLRMGSLLPGAHSPWQTPYHPLPR